MTNEELIYSLRYCFEKRKTVVGVPWYVWCDRAADAIEECMKKENAIRSLIDGRGDPVSCNLDAILKGEYE